MTLYEIDALIANHPKIWAEVDGDSMVAVLVAIDEDLPPAERRRRRVIGTLRIDE